MSIRLALIQDVEVEKRSGIMLEIDLTNYKERLANIAYEYYLGNKHRIKEKIFKVDNKKGFFKTEVRISIDDVELKKLLKDSFNYAFNMLEKEVRSKTVILP